MLSSCGRPATRVKRRSLRRYRRCGGGSRTYLLPHGVRGGRGDAPSVSKSDVTAGRRKEGMSRSLGAVPLLLCALPLHCYSPIHPTLRSSSSTSPVSPSLPCFSVSWYQEPPPPPPPPLCISISLPLPPPPLSLLFFPRHARAHTLTFFWQSGNETR